MLAELISTGGYLAVLVGSFVEGELVLVTAGALVPAGRLSPWLVVVTGSLGSFAWGQLWFRCGFRARAALLERFPAWRGRAQSVERWQARWGKSLPVWGRFAPGMGTVLPAMIGASGMSLPLFCVLDAIGSLIWAAVFTSLGMGAGAALQRFPSRWLWLGAAAAAALLGVGWAMTVYRRGRRREASQPEPDRLASSTHKQLIVTADDFGLALAVNEAVEQAHRHGILTTTSLMVGEKAAPDAVLRARRNPRLSVGLHLALCEGSSSLPASAVPLLTNTRGELHSPLAAIVWFFLLFPRAAFRRQLEAEIRAQFAAYRDTGLVFDHVNAHNNLQLHPVVLPLLIKVAREHGVRAVRVPYEPLLASWRAARTSLLRRSGIWLVMGWWASRVKRRLRREGFVVNDYAFGVADCGALDARLMARIIDNLPAGVSEIHCHPATRKCPELTNAAPEYQHQSELEALVHASTRRALSAAGVQTLAGFCDIARGPEGRKSA